MTFCMIQVCAFLAGIMLCFSYGIFRNYQAERLAWDGQYQLRITLSSDVTKRALDECLLHLSEQITDHVECFSVTVCPEDGVKTECRFTLKDGKTRICESFGLNLFKNGMADTYFTPEQETAGEQVALLGENYPAKDAADYVELQGKPYRVIGKQSWLTDSVLVPWASLDGETVLDERGITLVFDTAYTWEQYQEVAGIFQRELGTQAGVPDMEKGDGAPKKFTRTMLLASALITAVIAVDFSLLFYILEKRKRQYGIFMLCGMSRYEVIKMCLTECMLCVVPLFLSGILFLHIMVRNWMQQAYRYMNGVYSAEVYMILFLLFAGISLLALGIMIVPKLFSTSVKKYLL